MIKIQLNNLTRKSKTLNQPRQSQYSTIICYLETQSYSRSVCSAYYITASHLIEPQTDLIVPVNKVLVTVTVNKVLVTVPSTDALLSYPQ